MLPPSAAMPGTVIALPQRPFASLATKPLPLEPAAVQAPAAEHETEFTCPLFNGAMPSTSIALPQLPFVSLTTKAWMRLSVSVYEPPALQLPGARHEIEFTAARAWVLSVAVRGTSIALPQLPFVSLTTNAWERGDL